MKSCEDVYIKVGSCESVSVKAEPSFSDVSVKVEGLLDDVCVEDESVAVRAAAAELYADHIVKTEPCEDGYINLGSPCESVSVKTEPSFSDVSVNVGVSATAQLYIDHVVKDELVLGQEIVERRAPTTSKLATEVNQSLVRIVPSQQPMLKDCFVRLERIFDDDLLTLTRCTEDRDSTREEADVKRAYRITAVRKVEEYNGGQTTQKKPTGRSMTYHYQCAHCRYKTGTKLYLITHLSNARNHSLEKIYRCNICAYVAVSKSDLRRHVTIHTGDKPFKCGHCSYATCHKNGLVKHTLIHTGGKPYKCVQCSYVTGYRCNLKKHIRSHSGEKPYKCDQCSFASGYITSLLNHKRLHTGDKPFKCDQCSYTCFRKIYLRKHIMKHTGDKPYKCVQCGYASVCKSNLQNHIKTHTGDKPYKCDQCSYASCRNDSLKRHIKIHSGV